MDKPRAADILTFALTNQETAIDSIITAGKTFDGTQEDKEYALVSSGFALGVQYVLNSARDESLGFPLHAVADTEFLRNILAKLNDWQMTDPDIDHKMLEAVRGPIASFLSKQSEARRAIMISRFHDASGVPVSTIMGTGSIQEEEAAMAAVSVIQNNSSIYSGFVLFHGDTERVRNQRPYEFSEAYINSYTTPEELRAAIVKKHQTHYRSLVAFGRWFIDDMRKALERLDFGAENQGVTDSDTAQAEALKFIGRLSKNAS